MDQKRQRQVDFDDSFDYDQSSSSSSSTSSPAQDRYVCGCKLKDLFQEKKDSTCVACRLVEYCNKLSVQPHDAIFKNAEAIASLAAQPTNGTNPVQLQRLWSNVLLIAQSELFRMTANQSTNY